MIVINLIATFFLGATTLFAQTKTEKFKVYGNCGMCENRIEKAALSVNGVSKADWDKTNKMIVVAFDKSKTDVHKLHLAIAKVGHDTEKHKAKDDVYNNLAGCCKYKRASSSSIKHEGNCH